MVSAILKAAYVSNFVAIKVISAVHYSWIYGTASNMNMGSLNVHGSPSEARLSVYLSICLYSTEYDKSMSVRDV